MGLGARGISEKHAIFQETAATRLVGYEGLIDGRPSPVNAVTRERALLLVVPCDLFEQLFNGEDAVSRGFLDAIQKDLMATLRETLRPCARLAASV
jgi:CRP-like cAMP-binding protein